MSRITKHMFFFPLAFFAAAAAAQEKLEVDAALPEYEAVGGISGNVISVGSDTLANLMTLWAEEFNRLYPGVNVQIQAAGSSTAPPALAAGASNLGPMSRKMKPGEEEAFEKKRGYKPLAVAVAVDALAVYTHRDNPLQGLSMLQLDAIISEGRRCGHPEGISTWGQLGLTGDWADLPIQLYGRNSVSGTYGYFKKAALCKGDFKDEVNEQPGSASVVQSVGGALGGIGYSGIGYRTSDVRTLPLAAKGGGFVEPTPHSALSGEYYLSRFLYIYVNKPPTGELLPPVREFMRMVLSRGGQEAVVKDGYIPLSANMAQKRWRMIASS